MTEQTCVACEKAGIAHDDEHAAAVARMGERMGAKDAITVDPQTLAALVAGAEAWRVHYTAAPVVVNGSAEALWKLGQAISEGQRLIDRVGARR